MSDPSPMMVQYLHIKEQYRDAVLFFRLGDFYEMFNQDAIEISRLLNLTLTQRAGNPMCGIPFHASRIYIGRLLRLGKKIAICEQTSVPGSGKGLVERKVVEVITPGTAIEDEYLNQNENNYLASISVTTRSGERMFGFSYIDVTTGEFSATSFCESEAADRFRKEMGRIQPREILVQQSLVGTFPTLNEILSEYPGLVQNRYPDWSFNPISAYKRLCATFKTESLQAFSLDEQSPEVPSAGVLLEYLEYTSGSTIAHIAGIHVYTESEFLALDESTRKNLELIYNLRDGGTSFTLYEILNQTRTAMGTRLLRNWIQHPLTDRDTIEQRLSYVNTLYHAQKTLGALRDCLASILDIERLSGRIAMDRAHGKDLLALKQSLSSFLELTVLLNDSQIRMSLDVDDIENARSAFTLIQSSIKEDCPVLLSEGGVIKDGWSSHLDELRALRDNSNGVLENYLSSERKATGITNLKIRYNRMIGYFLEVSKGNLSSVPTHFIRRRSLANGDRFTTDRLVELETELNGVHATIIECEQSLFKAIRDDLFARTRSLTAISREIARIDVIQSFAHAATLNAWCAPVFSDNGLMRIVDGRHPVVESHLPGGEFVPNGITLSSSGNEEIPSFALITGPNMAGKSTFLRQTALITLMAQIGCFVPAESAELSPVDRIFCRVGASDNLARGESTFLVEMTETARILRSATENSLVIMDEVGRGTSTEDGLAIARAVTEFLLNQTKAKTLFATHYHELSRMEHPRLAGFCMDVLETEGTVVFLKKVKPGASANSYGIHVARLAGVPEAVLIRAREILQSLATQSDTSNLTSFSTSPSVGIEVARSAKAESPQLFSEEELILEEILSCNINDITPLQALALIDQWKIKAKKIYNI